MNRVLSSVQPVRPTRHRLLAALGIATVCVAGLLGLLARITALSATSAAPVAPGPPLLLHLVNEPPAPAAEATPDPAMDPLATPDAEPPTQTLRSDSQQPALAASITLSPPADDVAKSARDWQSIAKLTAKESMDEHVRQASARADLWQETHSVMFKPVPDTIDTSETPLLSDVRFIPRVRVLGLGVTIGSCFIGLPILGVPLEKRSTSGITLIVCADEAD